MIPAALYLAAAFQAADSRPILETGKLPEISQHREDWVEPRPPVRTNCPVPRPREDQPFILLGFEEGAAIADQAVAGFEEETTTGTITIGDGPGDIFLVVTSSGPMIYRFAGNVQRLNRVVVLNGKGGGVTGLDASKVSFGIGYNCQIGWEADHSGEVVQDAALIFGKLPDEADGILELHGWNLGPRGGGTAVPSPKFEQSSSTSYVEEQLYVYYPSGAAEIDPKSLISSATSEPYRVLPSLAGARQLEKIGMIVRATPEEIEAWKVRAKQRYGEKEAGSTRTRDVYRVKTSIELPIGLCGAHSLTLLVPSDGYLHGAPCHTEIIALDGRILTPYRQSELRRIELKNAAGGPGAKAD